MEKGAWEKRLERQKRVREIDIYGLIDKQTGGEELKRKKRLMGRLERANENEERNGEDS